jgi:four helix bundle protein
MSVPDAIRGDPLWGLRVYRAAMYAAELGRKDAAWLARKPDCAELADQLHRATASICVNIGEGYSRKARRDRSRFYEYALGSARESRNWYYQARDIMGPNAANARIALHSTLARILIVMLRKAREEPVLIPPP